MVKSAAFRHWFFDEHIVRRFRFLREERLLNTKQERKNGKKNRREQYRYKVGGKKQKTKMSDAIT